MSRKLKPPGKNYFFCKIPPFLSWSKNVSVNMMQATEFTEELPGIAYILTGILYALT